MSLIKTNTAKSAAKDIQLNYTIYFENGMKVGKEGYWGSPEEVKQKIGRYLEAAYGSKIKKIEAADTIEAQDSAAMDGVGYSNYSNARSAFSKALFSAASAAKEVLSAVSAFEKDPQYNKDYGKMVKSDADFVRKFLELTKQFKI